MADYVADWNRRPTTTVDQYGHLLPGDDTSAELIRETLDGRFRGSA